MKQRKPFPILCPFIVLVLFFSVAQTASADKTSDWKKLVELNDAYGPFLSAPSATHDAEFVSAWEKWRDEFTPFVQVFIKQYGSSRDELLKSFEGVDPPEGIYLQPANLEDLLSVDTAAQQKTIAGWLKKDGDEVYKRWENLKNPSKEKLELKADWARRALDKYIMAEKLDSGIAADAKKKAEKALEESEAVLKKSLADLKWPGNNPDFEGPGDPDALSAEALKLLRKMKAEGKQWSKPEYDDEHIPVAACLIGSNWEVYKKEPITQVPRQYSLKFFVAFKGTKSPDIAYGYNMYFYTQETSGVEKSAPFYYCNSEQYAKYKMLMKNVPSGGTGSSASSGFFGVIYRLLLSLLLIGGGIAAWNVFLREKLPQLSALYDALAGMKTALGYALLIVGILDLLRTAILSLSPLANILPQLAALALGLTMVSVKGLEEKVGHEKAKDALTKVRGFAAILEPRQVLLGQIALALGLIHLIIGGAVLF
jgi:hypothetical protein